MCRENMAVVRALMEPRDPHLETANISRNNPTQSGHRRLAASRVLAASAQNASALRNLEPRAAWDHASFLRPGSGVGLVESYPKKFINGEEMQ
jgi:hypothetical protein